MQCAAKQVVAVTGASGFIGRHVLRALEQRCANIVAATRDPQKLSDFRDRVRIVCLDLANPGRNLLEQLGNPDAVLHLAWEGLPNYRALRHFEVELPKQYAFLHQLIDEGLRNLVVTGTCFEYGMQSGALSEACTPLPSNPYGFAKDSLRRQLNFLKKERPFNLTWARLFYLYGEGQPQTSLYPQLLRAVAEGARTFDMSGGEQLRDYLTVEDVASNLVDLLFRCADYGSVNICSGKPRSVRALVESWLSENKWTIELNLGRYPYPDYEPMAFWGVRDKLDAILSGRVAQDD